MKPRRRVWRRFDENVSSRGDDHKEKLAEWKPLRRPMPDRWGTATSFSPETTMRKEPFKVEVPQTVLDDLHERLVRTRLAPEFANDDWRYGTNLSYLKELIEYWRERFDWRAV